MLRLVLFAMGLWALSGQAFAEPIDVENDPSLPMRAEKGDRPIRVIKLTRADNNQPKLLRQLFSVEDTNVQVK